ncbi:MAG TPA: alpha/beta fold hydrolase, partial [Xanthobacteraceae bacterium]|nr:alpha/beta fold hydrolase [Xanthobacteraceae bacterium]
MSDFIEIGGIKLECAWFGDAPESAPTLVLLHEGLGSVSIWRDFPEALAHATGTRVFAYSRAGYGKSDLVSLPRPLDFMQREAKEVLPALLDKIGFRRGILVGHSDGGTIAAAYAGSVQDHRVRGLVLIEPHFFVEELNLNMIRKVTAEYETSGLREKLARQHRDPDNTFRGWSGAWLDPGFRRVMDLHAELTHIRVPVLIVKGEHDPYASMEQVHFAERECYCPVDHVVIEGAAHAPHREEP